MSAAGDRGPLGLFGIILAPSLECRTGQRDDIDIAPGEPVHRQDFINAWPSPFIGQHAGSLDPIEAFHLHRSEDAIFVEQGGESFMLTRMNPENIIEAPLSSAAGGDAS